MEKLYRDAEEALRTFKLDFCCWFAPVRVGIYIIGWFNLLADVISLIGTTNDSLSPIIFKIQQTILPDYETKLVPLLSYSAEMCFTILLLCGLYRNDVVLLTIFIYCTIATVMLAFLVYSMVIASFDVLMIFQIVFSFVLQIYMIILVRSAIVSIKEKTQEFNGRVCYSAAEEKIKEISTKVNVESSPPIPLPEAERPEDTDPEGVITPPPKDHETSLETVITPPPKDHETSLETVITPPPKDHETRLKTVITPPPKDHETRLETVIEEPKESTPKKVDKDTKESK